MSLTEQMKIEIKYLNGVYKDIAENMGINIAVKFFENYKGLQITFPVRLYEREYIVSKIKKEYNGSNIKELARKYSYSERWIRQLLKEDD